MTAEERARAIIVDGTWSFEGLSEQLYQKIFDALRAAERDCLTRWRDRARELGVYSFDVQKLVLELEAALAALGAPR